jgi:hypothetical protein
MNSTRQKLFTIACYIILASIFIQFGAGYIGDKNWLLLATKMWLQGKKLYVDIFEVNPPLIIWLYSVPEFISLHFPVLKDYCVLVTFGLGLVALSTYISFKIISPSLEDTIHKKEFLLLLPFLFIACNNPAYFAEREWIFFVLTFPYLLRWLPSSMGMRYPRGLKIVVGLMAGIGFCMKPHCMLVLAGIQLVYILRERRLAIIYSVENLIIYAVIILYLAFIWVFTPEYITVILPMAIATYSGYGNRTGGLSFLGMILFISSITFVDFRFRLTSPYRKNIIYLIQLCPFFLLYALTNNGWGYAYNPLAMMVLFITGWILWEHIYFKRTYAEQGLPIKKCTQGINACVLNLFANGLYLSLVVVWLVCAHQFHTEKDVIEHLEMSKEINNLAEQVIKDNNAHSFGTISITFSMWPTIERAGATLETRFNHVWMLPKYITSDEAFRKKNYWIFDYVGNAIAHDLDNNKPDILYVDSSPKLYGVGKYIDLVAYFKVLPAFKTAISHYHNIKVIDACGKQRIELIESNCRYDIYKRFK